MKSNKKMMILSFDIMQHHLFWIFLVNVFVLLVSNKFNLDGFNVEQFRKTIYYCYTAGFSQLQIIYTIIAISMPLGCRYLYEKIKSKSIMKLNGGMKNEI